MPPSILSTSSPYLNPCPLPVTSSGDTRHVAKSHGYNPLGGAGVLIGCFMATLQFRISSMIAKRVIPCLDVHDGQVTRGVQFGKAEAGQLRNVGDPIELALRYNEQGADEMVFFDITASAHGRSTMVEVIEQTASQCFMPLTVGGGLRSVDDMYTMLRAGADKISINSSALANPELIRAGAEKFGSQCIVVSIDAKRVGPDKWEVFSHGGRKATGFDAIEWAKRAVSLGAGEIVLNSIDADGTKAGFDLE